MIKKQTTLKCNHCGKTASFIGERPEVLGPFYIEGFKPEPPPKNWYRIDPNYSMSLWSISDFVIGGDFCSVECMRDYIIKEIEERDSPKPKYYIPSWGIEEVS